MLICRAAAKVSMSDWRGSADAALGYNVERGDRGRRGSARWCRCIRAAASAWEVTRDKRHLYHVRDLSCARGERDKRQSRVLFQYQCQPSTMGGDPRTKGKEMVEVEDVGRKE